MTYLRAMTYQIPLLIALLIPTAISAQQVCGKRDGMVRQLSTKYSETKLFLGLTNGLVLELWASREPPYTWTMLKTYPNGTACVVAVGTNGHWRANLPKPYNLPETPT